MATKIATANGKKIRKRFKTTIPSQIRALLEKHKDEKITPAEIKSKLGDRASMSQIYNVSSNWRKKQDAIKKDKKRLDRAAAKLIVQEPPFEPSNGHTIDIESVVRFTLEVNKIGKNQAEQILSAMTK